jgi:hypothetical protein
MIFYFFQTKKTDISFSFAKRGKISVLQFIAIIGSLFFLNQVSFDSRRDKISIYILFVGENFCQTAFEKISEKKDIHTWKSEIQSSNDKSNPND